MGTPLHTTGAGAEGAPVGWPNVASGGVTMIGSPWLAFLAGLITGVVVSWRYLRHLRAKVKLMEFYLRSRIEMQAQEKSGLPSAESSKGRVV